MVPALLRSRQLASHEGGAGGTLIDARLAHIARFSLPQPNRSPAVTGASSPRAGPARPSRLKLKEALMQRGRTLPAAPDQPSRAP